LWAVVLLAATHLFLSQAGAAKIYPDDCPGMTLQQCVDSDNGGTGAFYITVKNGSYTSQNVTAFGRSGWIVAEPGMVGRPVFADSFWTWDAIGTASSGVRGIGFSGDSGILIWMTGTLNSGENGRITIEDNSFNIDTTAGLNRLPVKVSELSLNGAGTFQVKIRGNTIKAITGAPPSSSTSGLIALRSIFTTTPVDVAIFENTLQTNREDTPGLIVNVPESGNLDVIASHNEFRGARAIRLTGDSTSSSTRLNFYAFYNLFSDRYADGTLPASAPELVFSDMTGSANRVVALFNYNTFDGRWDLLNFTNHAITASTNDLSLSGNIFTESPGGNTGLINGAGTATVGGNSNILGPGLTTFSYVPNTNDQVGVDPLYVAPPARYALRDGSPAIDTQGNADLIFALAQAGVFGSGTSAAFLAEPHIDLDGFRRVIDGDADGTASADAGAYEWGDRVIAHESSNNNLVLNRTQIYDIPLNNDSDAVGLFTHMYRYEDTPGQYYDQPTGWWNNGTRWTIYNENQLNMPAGLVYSVFHPTGDRNTDLTGFRGLKTVKNGPSPSPSLDTGLTERNLAVFVRHVYETGSAIYDNSAVEVFYTGGSWKIYHVNSGDIPADATYMIYYQQPSENVQLVVPGLGDAGNFGGAGVVFPHPLLTGTAGTCVTPVIQQVALSGLVGNGLGDVPHHVGFDYFSGLGAIYAEDGTSPFGNYNFLSGGTGYFVLFDPQQAFECADRIYKDDFDH